MRSFVLLFIGALMAGPLSAQVPDAFSYQAVARNMAGDALVNTPVGVLFQLHQGAPGGSVVYAETHAPITNSVGLFALEVGRGTVTQGNFGSIDWSAGPYFLEVGLDPAGGSNHTSIGTQQLLSVPYALRAATVDTDNDVQQLTMSGDTLYISNGNYVVLPARFTTNCADGRLNGDETGVDCGGSVCVSCATRCSDGIQNGDETGVDCGGATCPNACATCTDGIQNGDETGVDCGGSCPNACVSCTDGIQNGNETGVDCGGNCPPCCTDADGDGWTTCAGDCNDASAAINPGATEICNDGVDNNCDGLIDSGQDADGDGWTNCNGDCNDANALVNPGALEIVGNGIDDNCNGSVDEAPAACTTAQKFSAVTGLDLARAMGLCQNTTANPPLANKIWGVISATQLLANGSTPIGTQLSNIQNSQSAVLVNYGTGGIVPTSGTTFAGLSTGKMRDAADAGFSAPNPGTNLATTSAPPPAYLTANGGSLPGNTGCEGACPGGSGAFDPVNLRLQIRVPTNVSSFSFQYRFVSSDYGESLCNAFNDLALVLLSSSAAGIPADRNILRDAANNPITVNNGYMTICEAKTCHTCPLGAGQLAGTGMELANTGSTMPWTTVTAPVTPGETITLDLMIFDVGDGIYDSNLLLDNFQWIPTPQ